MPYVIKKEGKYITTMSSTWREDISYAEVFPFKEDAECLAAGYNGEVVEIIMEVKP